MACLQATEERNSAQTRIAAAEDTATQAFEEVGNMRDEVADLRERLTKVRCTPLASAHTCLMHASAVPTSVRLKGHAYQVRARTYQSHTIWADGPHWTCCVRSWHTVKLALRAQLGFSLQWAMPLQATQEKVAALMQAAEAKGNRRASGGGGKGPASSPAKPGTAGGGWRVRSTAPSHGSDY